MNRINPDDGTHEITSKCPYCGYQFEATTGLSHENQRPPKPGDMSLCVECGEASRFGEGLVMEKITVLERERYASSDPRIALAMQVLKSRAESKYEDILDVMAVKVKEWKEQHMDLDINIQYNFPTTVTVVGALQDGINSKFITVNDHAMQMFKELGWLDDTPQMPTIMMVMCVLEHVFGKEYFCPGCEITKPASCFPKDNSIPGLCIECETKINDE